MSFELESILKIIMALVCGGLIGYEREYKNRPAGLRTHILVCVGAALVMVVAQFMYNNNPDGGIDTTRLGAQVVSGIGFLGAGTIIRERFGVKGLTTAASLWAVACIGIAVGSGYFLIAGVTTLVIIVSLILFRKLEKVMKIKSEKSKIKIQAEITEDIDALVKKILEDGGYSVSGMKFNKSDDNKYVTFSFDVSCSDENSWTDVSKKLYDNDNIRRADIEY
ncbi:MAG: MgtC/SapB family protein [Clostridia bacterium]|nr:MgtC/SapB family protein [Clostridia bacterium]MBN2882167.1 MgtC/SapB family protein [Clostridia bacterium]